MATTALDLTAKTRNCKRCAAWHSTQTIPRDSLLSKCQNSFMIHT